MTTINQIKKAAAITAVILIATVFSCKKGGSSDNITTDGSVKSSIESGNGITYKLYIKPGQASYKGILVMGSGNEPNQPSEGALDGDGENALCQKAAENGYVAAIVKYRKGQPANTDDAWNSDANMLGQDYDNCIQALSVKYKVNKNRSVVGGYSYASMMLFTVNSTYSTLAYCKGILGACGASGQWDAQNFKIPIYAVNCAQADDQYGVNGKALYDLIPANSPVKANSEGFTDNGCSTHCGKNWTDEMYARLAKWLPIE